MKIYETALAPNPRRVRIFLAEKNIPVEYVEVDIAAGENLQEDYKAKNITAKVPTLELEDGTFIGESVAICRYFEELYPENPLMGETPLEKALIESWQRRVEFHLLYPVAMSFQHLTGYFKDRMTPRKKWGKDNAKQAMEFLDTLNDRLAESTYIAGEDFSIADITALCTLDFARIVKIYPTEEHLHLKRWHQLVKSRPSASA